MRVGLYPRVSSNVQIENYSIGEQIDRMKHYCKSRDWIVYRIYTDAGFTGENMNRPGLQEMIKDIEDHKFDLVLVYRLDRLSRSQADTLHLIEKVFIPNGVDFVSMSENFDTSSPYGRAMIGILSTFAQLELSRIKERTADGRIGRAKEGKWHGGSNIPIGYDYKDGQLIIDSYEALQVKEAFELYSEGTPIRDIERQFAHKGYRHKHGLWSAKSIRYVLGNPLYAGKIRYKDQVFDGQHDAIVSQSVFDQIQSPLKRQSDAATTKYKNWEYTSVLGGLITCAHCGGKYTKQTGNTRNKGVRSSYYTCYSRCKKVKKMIKDPACKNKNYRMAELDNIIFDEIRRLASDPNYLYELQQNAENTDLEDNIRLIEDELVKLDAQVSRLIDLYSLGTIDYGEIDKKIASLTQSKTALESELIELRKLTKKVSIDSTIKIAKTFEEILSNGNLRELRQVVQALIHNVSIDENTVRIYWKFA